MSHCHSEHHGHGGHDHDAGDGHDDDITPAIQFSLYTRIHFDEIVTLNEKHSGSGQAIVKKTWTERLETEPELESDADEQLLMTIPFTGQVKLHEIQIRTSPAVCAPKTLKVFINKDNMDFDTAQEAKPTQVFNLSQTSDVQALPVRRALFSAVRCLTLFFPDNFASRDTESDEDEDEDYDDEETEPTRIGYLGFRGEWMDIGKVPANLMYEAAANPSDHAVKGTSVNSVGSGIGGRGFGM